jgi:phosphomannomutase
MQDHIFKEYDIRGKYPDEFNEEDAFQIARAFARFLRKDDPQRHLKIVAGRDMRHSSPSLFEAFTRAFMEEGGDIVDIGMITTPMLYYGVSYLKLDGGVMISASHNPNPYNGIKLTREGAFSLGGSTGIYWIRDLIKSNGMQDSFVHKKGKIEQMNIEQEYVDLQFQVSGVKKGSLGGITVALDAGNGVGGPIALKILEAAGAKVLPLCIEPDGNFPNHEANPLVRENIKDLISVVQREHPTLGVALDGDADRIMFLDEKGNSIPADLVTALIARVLLEDQKEKLKILYDVRASNRVPEVIAEAGGEPVQWKIGHALIKEKMRQDNVFFGGELSGHYFLGAPFFYEMPFFVLLKLCALIQNKNISLSRLIAPLQTYSHSGEINFSVKDKEKKMREIQNKYQELGIGKITKIDGIRVDFPAWWFLVRASNTEPLLRLVVEAQTKEMMEEKVKELSGFLKD